MIRKPLDDVTVIDVSSYVSASFGTMILANLGAEVIKVERPEAGDPARSAGPPFIDGESPYFMSVNYGKRSIELDLKSDDGLSILRELVADADAFVENFRPGTAERLGIDYESLTDVNESLLYCSVSAFGEDGPWTDRPGYDLLIQGMSGLMSVTGEPDRPPVKAGVPVSDLVTGSWVAQGVLAGLYERERSGEGDRIELAMYDAILPYLTKHAGAVFAGESPERMGSRDPVIAPYQVFEAADGYLAVGIGSQKLWTEFCAAIDRADLATDDRFETNPDRVDHMDELEAELEATFRERPVEEWVSLLSDEHGLPVGPINDVADALENEHVEARGLLTEVDHPTAGDVPVVEHPLRFDRLESGFDDHAPVLGEDTRELLAERGYDDEEIESLAADRVIGSVDRSADRNSGEES
ncbi:CaiB/BaiF CoA-transferase family protein [Natrialba sp. INN-245]|uniref:CaiB/BaiF CoA transferase family protein n=1 Tax=Natrialba sp. INN-245 TaxID=2690967 RepID=UPI00131319EF|nr:CaiB/BaiF CoA-transferase family protein [Natrialba sp. INN-245]MWV38419.1 CoA transferase [Natrialba sp. INN-245]